MDDRLLPPLHVFRFQVEFQEDSINTGATPVASDHRSASNASAARPSTARSATSKLDASARPV